MDFKLLAILILSTSCKLIYGQAPNTLSQNQPYDTRNTAFDQNRNTAFDPNLNIAFDQNRNTAFDPNRNTAFDPNRNPDAYNGNQVGQGNQYYPNNPYGKNDQFGGSLKPGYRPNNYDYGYGNNQIDDTIIREGLVI